VKRFQASRPARHKQGGHTAWGVGCRTGFFRPAGPGASAGEGWDGRSFSPQDLGGFFGGKQIKPVVLFCGGGRLSAPGSPAFGQLEDKQKLQEGSKEAR